MKSEKLWDRLAKNWDTPGVSLGENDIKMLKKTKKYLNDASIVLDYGCATGSIVFELADTVKEVHGVDISSNMIEIAKTKAAERNSNNAIFTQGTIFDERLQPESFDLILALSILHLVEDAPQVLERIGQLLKPGGIFISDTPCLGKNALITTLIRLPLALLSKIGILPHINFFTGSSGITSIMPANFKILENESSAEQSITECFIVARKI
ncbi:MAG: class I SAM-dependent methyltransferase [Anaerolineaceae bacterium]|nr:class I SAM-dependent methyltransferase [Anaerolineaceae bacterium]